MTPQQNLQLARQGEDAAAEFLQRRGCKILLRNYRTRLGEVDIIAEDKGTLCFVEVKSRSSQNKGAPCEAVDKLKQRQISKAALVFLKEKKLLDRKARFDVASVIYYNGAPEVSLIENAFELDGRFVY